jgi:DNA (cytosine-5)-methyltransferase 1
VSDNTGAAASEVAEGNPHDRLKVEVQMLRKPLMPTPNTMDHLPPRTPEKIARSKQRTPGGYANVRETVVNEVDESWGKFAPAIKRWEQVTGREAPSPTKPDGKEGQHRLSAEFTEWMMGLPDGWVTSPDISLTRNEALKACGNGVVPQQAVLALRSLLEGLGFNND